VRQNRMSDLYGSLQGPSSILPCGRILPPVYRSVERTGLSTLQKTVNGVGDLPKNFALVDVLETKELSKELSSGCEEW